ncbi:MAG: hypothetical protein B6D36_13550 [Planctomycetes bacterium UTPLA1]|nr:MAG: hypothetical protein B6D36_13550 [Planctomycetes bacterium UTPLA1]
MDSGPFTYQWRFDATPIDSIANPSAATATLLLNDVSAAEMGSYDCVVSNTCGSVTSDPSTLTVFSGGTGDGDVSGSTDGLDIQGLVNALTNGGAPSAAYCAYDMNADGVVDEADLPLLVALLLI